jgi:nucleotide-binding universal stress UspA family protein
VVAVDGSPSSAAALRWASRQADLTQAPLYAVIAWEIPATYGYVPVVGTLDWEDIARTTLEETIGKTLDTSEADRVHRQILRGHPAQVLLEVAEDADLLVVGCRGHGEFTGMLLGSVSQYLVTHAKAPVVVVHAES